MNGYFTEITWKIDLVLFSFSLVLSALLLAHITIRNHLRNKQGRKLLSIKRGVFDLLLSGEEITEGLRLPLSKDIAPSLFLDIETNRNRELAFFNKSEQEIFRKIFLHQDRIARLGKIAHLSRNKWSRIEAILSLGYCQSPSLSDVLKKSLWDKDEDICYFSMIALAQTKTIVSAKILLDFLKQRPLYHHKIVSLLGQFPQEISAETARLLKDQ
ncbi:MAG: HEAT repeat domain-containing protein, partial [Chlamydiae bacterium]|nr:HEAT repeat domain-containing protein [Chlamydiota bacterium]